MYTKQEISKQKQAFWTAFGRYMKPVLSAEGEVINWVNYKTGNKAVTIKMDADSRETVIALVVMGEAYERLVAMRRVFEEAVGESDWEWATGRVEKRLEGVNVLRTEDWPAIISFLKPRIIALDGFWDMARYQFVVGG